MTEDVSKKEEEIINYITMREIDESQKIREKIEKEILEKFGQEGIEIFQALNERVTGDVECPDCQKEAEKIINIPDELEDYMWIDDVVTLFLKMYKDAPFSYANVKNCIAAVKNQDPQLIVSEEIEKTVYQIIFTGLMNNETYEIADRLFNNHLETPLEFIKRTKEAIDKEKEE